MHVRTKIAMLNLQWKKLMPQFWAPIGPPHCGVCGVSSYATEYERVIPRAVAWTTAFAVSAVLLSLRVLRWPSQCSLLWDVLSCVIGPMRQWQCCTGEREWPGLLWKVLHTKQTQQSHTASLANNNYEFSDFSRFPKLACTYKWYVQLVTNNTQFSKLFQICQECSLGSLKLIEIGVSATIII